MGSVSVMLEQATPPPLVVMSLCLKITLNPKNGTNEVCVLCGVCIVCVCVCSVKCGVCM